MSKNKILDREKRQRISDRVLILTLCVQILLLVNQSIGLYTVAAQTMQASITEPTGETLKIHIETNTGRPNLATQLLKPLKTWIGSYFIEGTQRTNSQTSLTITVTGSNIANTATIDYYIEAVPQTGGNPYRFLSGNGTSITVGGGPHEPTNQTTIENHLTAMGLSTTTSHTIDYYVYVKAETTGAVSGETLTSEITYTKFDTITYTYGSPVSQTYTIATGADDGSVNNGDIWQYDQYDAIDDYSSTYDDITPWFRFTNIDIPKDTPITSAYLKIYSYIPGTIATPQDFTIYGNYAGNAANPTSYNDYWSKTLTTNSATWDTDTIGNAFAWHNTPDLSNIIEEILSHTSWSTGNALQLFIHVNEGYTERAYVQWVCTDWTSENRPPKLDVTYISYSTSWYPLPPMSLATLPVTLDVIALTALITATGLALRENRRPKI